MSLKVEILCPSKKCRKCKRMIRTVEKVLTDEKIAAEVSILDRVEDYVRYDTWVLPSLFVNGISVARGYVPPREELTLTLRELTGNNPKENNKSTK